MCSLLQYIVFFPHLLESNIMPSTLEEVLCSSHNGTVFSFGYLSQSCTCKDNDGKLSTKLIIFYKTTTALLGQIELRYLSSKS